MSFIKSIEEALNYVLTENNDLAYSTTGSYCLDYFALIGGLRYNLKDALTLFIRAYNEDKIKALKLLVYTRDIKEGLGERKLFRILLYALSKIDLYSTKLLIPVIKDFGRFDDLFILLDTDLKKDVIKYLKEILENDLNNLKNNNEISLLGKWLPSFNTSSKKTIHYAKIIQEGLGISKEKYRKLVVSLRKNIIENNLRKKDYSFQYENVPGLALFRYKKNFLRNDEIRFKQYLEYVKNKKVKINSKIIYPYQIVKQIEESYYNEETIEEDLIKVLDTLWNSFDRSKINSKTLVVRDGSASMFDHNTVTANSVATSLAILFSENLTNDFNNSFVSFSASPRLVKIKGDNIVDKVLNVFKNDDCTTTNILAVYNLILSIYKKPNFNKEDSLDRIIIISDMQFDGVIGLDKPTYDYFESEFINLGYKLPKIIFWSVRSRQISFPSKISDNVLFISGSSSVLIDFIINNNFKDAFDVMEKKLKNYNFLD